VTAIVPALLFDEGGRPQKDILVQCPTGILDFPPSPVLGENGMCRSRRTVIVILGRSWNRNSGIGALDLVEMQNGKHRAVDGRVEEFVAVPTLLPWDQSPPLRPG
jgi:hypothetical protein